MYLATPILLLKMYEACCLFDFKTICVEKMPKEQSVGSIDEIIDRSHLE